MAAALGEATARAALPGQNGKIACDGWRGAGTGGPTPGFPVFQSSRSEIYTMNPVGSDFRLLTNDTVTDIDPSFSPDGRRIAFSSRREGSTLAVHTMNSDGTDVQRLLFIPGQSTQPNYSPDGSNIVFMDGSRGGFEISRVNVITGALTPITTNPAIDGLPSWSPDGSKIAFDSTRPSRFPPPFQVYTTSAAGGTPEPTATPLTAANPANPTANSYSPHWSPDGSRLTFLADRDGNAEVYSMRSDGSDQRRLTFTETDNPATDPVDESEELDPAYSPDGTKIVFSSGRSGDYDVYTMNAVDGSGVRRLTNSPGFDGRCEWQPIRRASPPPDRPAYPLPPPAGAAFADCPTSTANVIRGTLASDRINGTPRADRIFAGTGNDVVDGLGANDCIDLGPGTDRGQGGDGQDLVVGGLGADRLSGNLGNDRLRGGSAGDRLIGGFGNDRLHGQSGRDRILGERGRDRINGGSSNDVISSGSSGDRVAGDQGNDRINGNSGNDSLSGNSGRDRISGSSGRDRISGGSGNDRISARDGRRDRINCGSGRDRVVADRVDRIARNCERSRRR